MTYLASVAGNDRQHTFRTCSLSFEVRTSSTRLQKAERRHRAALVSRIWPLQVSRAALPCVFAVMCQGGGIGSKTELGREVPQSLCRSGHGHPNCHCSVNTVKCFCSCCCPLKILAALMTAAKISRALPFTCQQRLKIVQVASGHC